MEEQKKPKAKPKAKKTAKIGKRLFVRTTYIKGYGTVAAGEELTKPMIEAWAKHTKVPIDTFVKKE